MDETNPRRCLLKHQRDFVSDQSRFKLWNKSRQIGGSFALGFEIVEDCLTQTTDWVVLSASEETVGEFLRNCQKAVNVFLPALSYKLQTNFPEPKYTASDVVFGNESRILALPANPRTARSYSANVALDEFAHHQHPDLIWDATFPIITNPLRGELKIRVISSPNGQGNLFHKLCAGENDFSKHRTTIHDAIKNGLKIDLGELKRNCLSESLWKQNYECEFLDESNFELVITREIVDFCLKNPPIKIKGVKTAFIDWGGTIAETAIAIMDGNEVLDVMGFVETNEMSAVGRVIIHLKRFGVEPKHVWCDISGIGHPMATMMAEAGFPVTGVNNGKPSLTGRFQNRGAEMWFDTKQMLQERRIIMFADEKLIAQLTNRRVDSAALGKMSVEKKEKLASRGIASPDRADALCGVVSCSKFLIPTRFSSPLQKDDDDLDFDARTDILRRAGAFAGY